MNFYSLAELFEDTIGNKILIRSFDADRIDISEGEISFLWAGQGNAIKVLRQDSGNSAIYSEDDDIFWDDADGDIDEFDALIADWLATNGYCKYNCKNCKVTDLGTELVCPKCKTPHWVKDNGRIAAMHWSATNMQWEGDPNKSGLRPVHTKVDPPKQYGYFITHRGANPDGSLAEETIGLCSHHYDQLVGINHYRGIKKCWPLQVVSKYQPDTAIFIAKYAGNQGVYCACCYHRTTDLFKLIWQDFGNFLIASGGKCSSDYLSQIERENPEWAAVYRQLDNLLRQGYRSFREVQAFLRYYVSTEQPN